MAHVRALDGLRGIAVAAVVAYHVRPDWVPGGFLGVDLFFVLSGYLITSLLLHERAATGRIDLLSFAGRRLRRLLPAVLAMTVAVVVYEMTQDDLGRLEQARRHALATLGYVANWVFIADGDSYFADVAGPSMFRHVWSLAIEEQFYLLWPLAVLLLVRWRGIRAVGVGAAVLGAVSLGWMIVHHTGGDPSRVYFGTDTRIFEPLIGAAAATAWPLGRAESGPVGPLAGAGLTVWLTATFVVDDRWGGFYEGGAALLGLCAVAVVLGAGQSGPVTTVLEMAPLVRLGEISYGVYLWHWPILLMARRAGWSGAGGDLAIVAITLAVSVASHVLIEQPVRRGTGPVRLLTAGWRPIGAAAVAIAVVAVVVVGGTRGSVPAEAVTVEEALEAFVNTEGASGSVGDGPPSPAADQQSGMELPITVVLVGDSAAWTLGGGLVSWGTDHGPYDSPFDPAEIQLVNLARKGYRLVPGATTELGGVRARPADDLEDEAWWRATIPEVGPDLIVAMFGLSDLQGREIDGERLEFGSAGFDLRARAAAETLLTDLAATAPVVVLSSPPLLGEDMPQPEMAAFFEDHSAERVRHLSGLLGAVADGGERITMLDFAAWLCPADECRTTADGSPVRHDGVHFSAQGAALAAGWLTDPLLAAARLAPRHSAAP